MLVDNLVYFNPLRISVPSQEHSHVLIERPINNFGDLLSPTIVREILRGQGVNVSQKITASRRLLAVGSILHFSRTGDVVWGSGINGKIPKEAIKASALDIRLLRGPLSRHELIKMGFCAPEVYGDPGLLMAHLFPSLQSLRQVDSRHSDYVVVANYNDLSMHLNEKNLVDPSASLIFIISRILSAKFVIASSLHALVIADSFGVPSRPLISATEAAFKYHDYYLGTGRNDVAIAQNISHALDLGPVPSAQFSNDSLLETFPIDLFV